MNLLMRVFSIFVLSCLLLENSFAATHSPVAIQIFNSTFYSYLVYGTYEPSGEKFNLLVYNVESTNAQWIFISPPDDKICLKIFKNHDDEALVFDDCISSGNIRLKCATQECLSVVGVNEIDE